VVELSALNKRDRPGQRSAVAGKDTRKESRVRRIERMIGPLQHILDHAIQPKPLAVLWRIHATDAVFLE
jgi:hypothetical protein